MTSDNLYMNFQETESFQKTKTIINNLEENIKKQNSNIYSELDNSQKSILKDVCWKKMNRKGERTMRETTYVDYSYKRPKVKIIIFVKYSSDSQKLQKVTIQINLGYSMDYTIYDSRPENTENIEFTITPQ